MSKPKVDQEIKNNLFSTENTVVIKALNSIKEKGNKEYLPILFELLLAQPEKEIKKKILKLLGTVKEKDCIPYFAEALQNENYYPIQKDLLITCWQNGLDFSPHFNIFTNLVIESDWDVAFEAFTVIENLEHFPPVEETKEIKLKIAGALKKADEKKAYFLEELLRMFP